MAEQNTSVLNLGQIRRKINTHILSELPSSFGHAYSFSSSSSGLICHGKAALNIGISEIFTINRDAGVYDTNG